MSGIEYGYCQCGCGKKTSVPMKSCKHRGIIKGVPRKYIWGHNCKAENNYRWKGGRVIQAGYFKLLIHDHSRSGPTGYVSEHVIIAENALGKSLPIGAEIHHVNGIKTDNSNSNLVVCQDHEYHFLLHRRTRALEKCGNANWFKCPYCKSYDDPVNMSIKPDGKTAYHNRCQNKYRRAKNEH